jgi:glycosyltransferase involved in cell wall biosynthesis
VTTRIALVMQGYHRGWGVPSVARWLRQSLEDTGDYVVDIHDLATSRDDTLSRRVSAPATWARQSLRKACETDVRLTHWGANAVELEPMRYRPRAELTRALRAYDLIQVVSGGPALAAAVVGSGPPVALQVATRANWERPSQAVGQRAALRRWRRAMTTLTSRQERSAIRAADVVLVENDAMLSWALALGRRRVIKAPPGVDVDFFTPPSDGWAAERYVLSVCRLDDRRKGLERLLRGYELLAADLVAPPPLVLACRGALPAALSNLIIELGLSNVVSVRSDVSRADLPNLYRSASLYLQASYEEGLGMSVLEAMASGLPVVCTDTAGTKPTFLRYWRIECQTCCTCRARRWPLRRGGAQSRSFRTRRPYHDSPKHMDGSDRAEAEDHHLAR